MLIHNIDLQYNLNMDKSEKRINHLKHRLATIKTIADKLKLLDQRFFWYRLSAFLGAWVLAILTRFLIPGMAWLWVLLGVFIVFLVVVFYHRRLDKTRERYQIAEEWFTQQIARASLDWENIPELPFLKSDPDHPFMNDLNLVGERSLLQLIDTTNTTGGQRCLFDWFLHPELVLEKIYHRQSLVKETLNLPGFRSQIMLIGRQINTGKSTLWDDKVLTIWLQNQTRQKSLLRLLILLVFLAALNFFLLAMNLLAGWGAYWQFSLILYLGIYFFQYRAYQATFQQAYKIHKDLQPLVTILQYLETYPAPRGSQLAQFLSTIQQEHQRPSRHLRKIVLISSAASIQNNQILSLLINAILPWDMFFAYILERFKVELQRYLPGWLSIWYQVEALTALANFAYLNPEYHFPDISPNVSTGIFSAHGLGHPLIAKKDKVVNDFAFSNIGEVAIISGSNMSGKSTFLRTLGINSILAYTGTVVNAKQFRISLMRLFTCIQVNDSLKDSFSYFYAEVRRLRALLNRLEETSSPPLFYLIDEIFQGTNHKERRVGSLAYIKALVNANGVGAISTHDIELSKLAEQEVQVRNYNFQDSVVDGKMKFDYTLRRGPSPTTNALKIMAIEGLPVNDDHHSK